jgi:protoporphyrin/coproporphyrin ferrochelatase
VKNQIQDPQVAHSKGAKIGVLIVNLGTPDAPTAQAVRKYLKQFLSDPRVVEIPRIIWWCILNLIILPIRAGASAKKYATIWLEGDNGGSPLLFYSKAQVNLLRESLNQKHHGNVVVELAMRYGNPSIPDTLKKMDEMGVTRMLVMPMYPQYSATTSASTFDEIFRIFKEDRNPPALRTIKNYHDHPLYIQALKTQVENFWLMHGRPNFVAGDKFIMSFHGVPKRTLDMGDPYHCECYKTGRLLREALGLSSEEAIISFQSRFGKAEWLKPYTAPLLERLGQAKTNRVDIFCPGFPADCLETLEEIAMEGKEIFEVAGGGEYFAIPCMNMHSDWIHAMTTIVEDNLQGWQTPSFSIEDIQKRLEIVATVKKSLAN